MGREPWRSVRRLGRGRLLLLGARRVVEQQIEIYDAGVMLAYDRHHVEDDFGMLSQVCLDPDEWKPFEIDIHTYQREVDGQPYNRRS
ncbi:hypothetical protein OHA10_03435 [Kribbella sp. NBC_00662]|uniref:hypothetical protein n=1 Tax=Kribbella sp. NBC_00662 TaxID=2975969 RepID=UPI00324EF3B3